MATIPYNKKNPADRYHGSLGEDNAANWRISDSLKPNFQHGGGVYRLAAQTYADGDDVVFNFDSAGYLMCTLKSAITVSGDLAVDVWSYQKSDGTDANAWVFTHDEDLSAVSEVWQGFGGYDETADLFRAFPIGTDNAAAPANAQGIPILGEYNATPVTLGDGDFGILALDVSSHLLMSGDFVYAEDSGHTTADEGVFILGVRQDTLATSVDTDADYGAIKFNAKGSQYVDLSSVLGLDMSATNGAFFNLTDNTTVAGVTAGLTALKVDLVGEGGAIIDATNPIITQLTDGTRVGADFDDLDSGAGTEYRIGVGIRTVANGGSVEGVRITDGTNYLPTMDVAARAGYQYITDGTNTMPTGDALARSIFVNVGDGTTTATVNTAFAATEATAQSSLLTTSLIMGWDATAGTLLAPSAAVDNTVLSATPNVMVGGGIYKATLDSYDDNDAVPFHFSPDGKLLTDAEVTMVDYTDDSNEFTVASSKGLAMFGLYESVEDSVADGDVGIFHMTADRHLIVRPDGFDTGTDSLKTYEIDPVSDHYVVEDLAEATSQGNGTTYYYILMDGYRNVTLHWLDTPGIAGTNTYTLEASVDPDEAGGGTGDYFDVSTALGGAANWTTDQMVIVNTPVAFKYLRVKVVRANDGGNTDGAWTIHEKRLY